MRYTLLHQKSSPAVYSTGGQELLVARGIGEVVALLQTQKMIHGESILEKRKVRFLVRQCGFIPQFLTFNASVVTITAQGLHRPFLT